MGFGIGGAIRHFGSSIRGGFHKVTSGANDIGAGVAKGVGGIPQAATNVAPAFGRAVSTTLSADTVHNPSQVGNAWAQVGQAAYNPVAKPIVESTGEGRSAESQIKNHQSELMQAGAVAANPLVSVPVVWDAANKAMIRDPKRQQENAYNAEMAAAKQLENRQNDLINQVRSQFGSTGMNQQRQSFMDAQRMAAMQQATGNFQQGLTEQRIRAAQSGQLGGSVDQSANNGLLQQYYNTVAGGAASAANAGQQFDDALQQQRINTERAIRGSSINDLTGMQTDIASMLNAAGKGSVITNALGNAMPQLANMGSNYAQLRAMGAA